MFKIVFYGAAKQRQEKSYPQMSPWLVLRKAQDYALNWRMEVEIWEDDVKVCVCYEDGTFQVTL
jgi:hypothetical protein